MYEDSRAKVPVVLSGFQSSTNITVRLTVDYGQLFAAHDPLDDEIEPIAAAGEFLIQPGSQDEVNSALEDLWYAPPTNWNSPAHHTVGTLSVSTYESDAEEFRTPPSTLLIRVIPVNDPPSLHGPSGMVVLESRSTVIEGIVMEDIDAHESHGIVQVNISVEEEGSLVELGTKVGLYVTESLPRSKTFLGSVRNVNSALAGLTYRGPPQFSGGDELLVTADDGGNTGEGGVLNASLTVPISVRSVNDPPRVTRDSDMFLHGTEDESIPVKGVAVEDADAGNGSVKLTLEPRYGTIALRTEGLQVDFREGRQQLDAKTTIVGTLEVRREKTSRLQH